ncbi:MAG: hypothetical protein ACYCOU_00490 [Sulfobacillus sp.]
MPFWNALEVNENYPLNVFDGSPNARILLTGTAHYWVDRPELLHTPSKRLLEVVPKVNIKSMTPARLSRVIDGQVLTALDVKELSSSLPGALSLYVSYVHGNAFSIYRELRKIHGMLCNNGYVMVPMPKTYFLSGSSNPKSMERALTAKEESQYIQHWRSVGRHLLDGTNSLGYSLMAAISPYDAVSHTYVNQPRERLLPILGHYCALREKWEGWDLTGSPSLFLVFQKTGGAGIPITSQIELLNKSLLGENFYGNHSFHLSRFSTLNVNGGPVSTATFALPDADPAAVILSERVSPFVIESLLKTGTMDPWALTQIKQSGLEGRPPLPLKPGHTALMLSTGAFDGEVGESTNRYQHVVKGTIQRESVGSEEPGENEGDTAEKHYRFSVAVRALSHAGATTIASQSAETTSGEEEEAADG